MILAIIYWVLVVLAAVGIFGYPPLAPSRPFGAVALVLFIIIGLKIFPIGL